MNRKHRLFRTAVFLLVFVLTVLSVFPTSAASLNTGLLVRASAIESALSAAFEEKAVALSALADEYRAGTKAPTDEDGNPLNTAEAIAFLEGVAAKLPTLKADYYALAIVENAYENEYIGAYKSFASLSPDIADILVTLFDLDKLSSEDTVRDALIRSYAIAIGDTYASYFNESEYAEYMADTEAKYGGIGVTVTQLEDGYVEVLSVTPDSPAEKAGIQLGDIIVGVEGEDFVKIGYSTAINMIRGKEGEAVTITVKRGESTFEVTMVRETLIEYTVTYKMLSDGKTGFIRISQFDEGTFAQFVEAYEALGTAGAEKFVFDVRNNLGGRLEAVLGVLEYILPDKDGAPLIRMQYKGKSVSYASVLEYIEKTSDSGDMKRAYAKAKNHEITAPIAVLCNGFTASAGELFTSCLKDYGVAKVIGTTTYGKGMGQTGYYLTDYYANGEKNITYYKEAVFNLSTFYYAPPVSDNYEGKGITPDLVVELSKEAAATNFYKLSEEMDGQLSAAKEYLAEKNGVTYVPPAEEEPTSALSIILWTVFGVLATVTAALIAFFIVALYRQRKETEALSPPKNKANDGQL